MVIGILGGMGPEATNNFYRKIIQFTDASKDQEHIHVIMDSNTEIPDRSQFICGGGEDPRIEMVRSLVKLEMMGAEYIAIPCNTAHYFYDDIKKYTKINILNMIHETAVFARTAQPEAKEYLLLATEGTYMSGIYKKKFNEFGLKIIEPDSTDKKTVMNWIYEVKSGTFRVKPVDFLSLVNKYRKDELTPIILGCTELPILTEKLGLSEEYVDPVTILAKRCAGLQYA
ncbi:MAG TPA: amino acid racemase [Negativicutes bacterium]|nr:amino acid racemase [Negativicutes bacterium]